MTNDIGIHSAVHTRPVLFGLILLIPLFLQARSRWKMTKAPALQGPLEAAGIRLGS